MVCKHCEGTNIVEGVIFGNRDIHHVGPKYSTVLFFETAEQTYCDICIDCGEINRIYIKPNLDRKWIKGINKRTDLIHKTQDQIYSDFMNDEIRTQIEKYSELLISGDCKTLYVHELDNYEKHELYKHIVRTKGPSYRLYVDKTTHQDVLIREATMNLHRGKYVVKIPPQPKTSEYDLY